jgi:hypothetical protein
MATVGGDEMAATTFNLHNAPVTWPDGAAGVVRQADGPATRDTANGRQLFVGFLEVTHEGHDPVHGDLMISWGDQERVESEYGADTSAPIRAVFQNFVQTSGLDDGFSMRAFIDDFGIHIAPVNAEGR